MAFVQYMYTDELLEWREEVRKNKDYKLSDKIRNILDERLVFVFDSKDGQEVYHLYESYFSKMEKISTLYNIKFESKRKFVEYKIKENIRLNALVDNWIKIMVNKQYKIKKKRKIIWHYLRTKSLTD